jgi:hypothetical protein
MVRYVQYRRHQKKEVNDPYVIVVVAVVMTTKLGLMTFHDRISRTPLSQRLLLMEPNLFKMGEVHLKSVYRHTL